MWGLVLLCFHVEHKGTKGILKDTLFKSYRIIKCVLKNGIILACTHTDRVARFSFPAIRRVPTAKHGHLLCEPLPFG